MTKNIDYLHCKVYKFFDCKISLPLIKSKNNLNKFLNYSYSTVTLFAKLRG